MHPERDPVIEQIVLQSSVTAPLVAPARRTARKSRKTTDGREIVQHVHGIVERLARDNALETMARYLRGYRVEVARLTQDEMAFLLDVGRVTYQRMEAAKDGVSIGTWLRAMQYMQHLPVLANMDLARDRAALERVKRITKEQVEAFDEMQKRNPGRFFG